MTIAEKEQVNQLRAQGFGATRISEAMSISVNTIKSHLYRNPIIETKAKSSNTGESVCKQCGAPLSQLPKRKTKLFCSDTCRLSWWNSNRSKVSKKSAIAVTCAYCGKRFDCYDSENRKYCSHACYINNRFRGEHNDTRTV